MALSSGKSAKPGIYFSRFLDTNGDGTGTKNAIGNQAATNFFISPDQGTYLSIGRLLVQITDIGNMVPANYGNLAELTNGIKLVKITNDGTETDLVDGFLIKTNGQWARYCFDAVLSISGGVGENYVNIRWTFSRGGKDILLLAGDRLEIQLDDDFTGLIGHTFLTQGRILRALI